MHVLIFSTIFSEIFLIISINYAWNNNKCTFILVWSTRYSCHVLKQLEFSREILEENTLIKIFTKIRLVGAELFHAGEQMDKQTWRR